MFSISVPKKREDNKFNCPLDPLLDKKGGTSTKTKSVISCIDGFKSYKRIRRGRAKNGTCRVHG